MCRLARLLIVAGLAAVPTVAATVFLSSATPSGSCSDSVTASPIATVTLTGVNCTNGFVTLTATSLDFASTIVGTGYQGDTSGGIATIDARSTPGIVYGTIRSGTTGFLNIIYTDQFTFGLGFSGEITARVGQATGIFHGKLDIIHVSASHSTLLPIAFGAPFEVPLDSLYVQFNNMQSPLNLSASQILSFETFDAEMNPLGLSVTSGPGITAAVPEPATGILCGVGVLLFARSATRRALRVASIPRSAGVARAGLSARKA